MQRPIINSASCTSSHTEKLNQRKGMDASATVYQQREPGQPMLIPHQCSGVTGILEISKCSDIKVIHLHVDNILPSHPPPFSTTQNLKIKLILTTILPTKPWDTQVWHPKILDLPTTLLPYGENLLKSIPQEKFILSSEQYSKLVAWTVHGLD